MGCLLSTGVEAGAGTQTPSPSKTIVSDYVYNADSALVQVTTKTTANGQTTEEVQYLTWDNYVPEMGSPLSGSVEKGNGNLVAYGATPGTEDPTASFGYDLRNRLTRAAQGGGAVTYTYHPTQLLETSKLASGDTRTFYYDVGATPRVTNIFQSDQVDSAWLLSQRLLSSGSQQVLLSPRKDVAGVYDPSANPPTLEPFVYGPYGSQEGEQGSPPASYDLSDNPFRFAGEYEDPTWGGYYMRQRWYDPGLQSFLSRDPDPHLNRFGYTEGNPISRVDRSGRSYRSAIGDPIDHWLDHLEGSKVGGAFARFGLGFLIGPLEIIANPSGFWHDVKHDQLLALYLGASVIATEFAMASWSFDGEFETGAQAFISRMAIDSGLGAVQSAVSATSPNFKHFDTADFWKGLEFTAGGIVEGRLVAGIGYRPFNLDPAQAIESAQLELEGSDNDAIVFRMKTALAGSGPRKFLNSAGPIGDLFGTNYGWYHEVLVAVQSDGGVFTTEAFESGIVRRSSADFQSLLDRNYEQTRFNLQRVGRITMAETYGSAHFQDPFFANPLGLDSDPADGRFYPKGGRSYNLLLRNCQQHSQAVINQLFLRD